MPKKESIWVRPPTATDRFNDPLPEVEQPAWREIPGATVVPRGSGDFQQRGPIIISGFMVKLPGTAEVGDTDHVKVRDIEHEIDGVVGDYGKAKIFYTIRVN